jgi:DNA-binding transcriptional MerR regulator
MQDAALLLLSTACAARVAAEVAEVPSVSESTIRSWRRAGRLPVAAQSSSGIYLFRRSDVEHCARTMRRAHGTSTQQPEHDAA